MRRVSSQQPGDKPAQRLPCRFRLHGDGDQPILQAADATAQEDLPWLEAASHAVVILGFGTAINEPAADLNVGDDASFCGARIAIDVDQGVRVGFSLAVCSVKQPFPIFRWTWLQRDRTVGGDQLQVITI